MPHVISINQNLYWDHTFFAGRRVNKDDGTPDPDLSWWSIAYAAFGSEEDAKAGTNAVRKAGQLKVRGALLDDFFLNAGGTGYEMTDAKVFGALKKLLSEDLTETELAEVEGLEQVRSAMVGVPMFNGAFTVSAL